MRCCSSDAGTDAGDDFRAEADRAFRGVLSAVARSCRALADGTRLGFELLGPALGKIDVIGASLGLPVAVATISRALGRAPNPTVAGSAAVTSDGDLTPVLHLPEKIAALWAAQAGVSMVVVAEKQELPAGYHAPIGVKRAARLEAALCHFGLALDGLPEGPIENHIERVDRFKTLNVQPVASSEWRLFADQAWESACALHQARELQKASESRAWSALFSLHAGDAELAFEIVSTIDERLLERFPTACVWKHSVQASAAIDREDYDQAMEQAQLAVAACGSLESSDARLLVGYARGTLGRAHMHAGEFASADIELASAIDHFLREGHHREVPRTMCYRATCLRLAGRVPEAFEVVEDALARTGSGPSSALLKTTALFLRLERGRIRLRAGQWADALLDLEFVRDSQSNDESYPRLGAVRDLPLALWMSGRREEAAGVLRTCLALARRRRDTLGKVAAVAAGVALVTPELAVAVPAQELWAVWNATFPGNEGENGVRAVLATWVY